MPFYLRHEGSKRMWITWRAISARPYFLEFGALGENQACISLDALKADPTVGRKRMRQNGLEQHQNAAQDRRGGLGASSGGSGASANGGDKNMGMYALSSARTASSKVVETQLAGRKARTDELREIWSLTEGDESGATNKAALISHLRSPPPQYLSPSAKGRIDINDDTDDE